MTNPMEIYEKLKSAMPDAPAGAVVQAIQMAFADTAAEHSNTLANKVDGIKFDAEMHQMESSFNHGIAAFGTKMETRFLTVDSEFQALEAKMQSGFDAMNLKLAAEISKLDARIDTKIAEGKAEMIRWMFIFWVGQVAATVSVIKLLK
jgi:hypothetical protein